MVFLLWLADYHYKAKPEECNKRFVERNRVKYSAEAECEMMTFGHREIFRFAESEMK